jgi:CBS domain-containing protein
MRPWQVRDVMTRTVTTVGPDTPYREIVDVVTAGRVGAVPVVDGDRRVVGIVSEADLLHKVELTGRPQRRVVEGRRRAAARTKAAAVIARDLMTARPVTATATMSVVSAARAMDREGVKRLPVVDNNGRLVGIVTRSDLLKVHRRTDAAIRSEVVHEVLERVLAVEEGVVRVSVNDGVVRLVGQLDRRSAAETAGTLAARIDGVVEVVNRLGYDYDDSFLAALAPESSAARS